MSWEVKYRVSFQDDKKLPWKIDILEDLGVAPTIIELQPGSDPLNIEWNSDSDEFNESIRPSKANINVFSTTDFSLVDLYSDEDFHFKVNIYKGAAGTSLFWTGWIVTGEYSEPYDQPPYPVTIVAVDGLNYLKQILYASSVTVSGGVETITYYEDRKRKSKILLDILGKCFITTFTEYLNIYEESMSDGTGDSPLDQSTLDVDVFRDMYCWDVLSEILKPYDAVIRQNSGVFCIYRPVELTSNPVYGRAFTAETTKSSTNFNPDQVINRSGSASDLKQMPGSSLMVIRPAKKISINQDYGYKESWLNNWEILGNTISGTFLGGYTVKDWTASLSFFAGPMSLMLPDERDGVLLSKHNNYPTLTKYLYQTFGTNAINSLDIFGISFEYLIYNNSGAATGNRTIYVEVITDGGYYLYNVDERLCEWSAVADQIEIASTSPVGTEGWQKFERKIIGLPTDGTITVKLYGLDDDVTDVYVGFKNFKFFSTSDQMTIKSYPVKQSRFPFIWKKLKTPATYITFTDVPEVIQKQYSVANAINGVEKDYYYLIGDVPKTEVNIDNIVEQFMGAIAITKVLASAAAGFVALHAGDYSGGGVIVTCLSDRIIFTSDTAGTAFTGATSISNTSGNLTGSVANTQANRVAAAQVSKILLAGFDGVCEFGSELGVKEATFDTDLETTADVFVAGEAASFLSVNGIILTRELDGADVYLVLTANVAGVGFTPVINRLAGSLDGSLPAGKQTANVTALPQIDTITLTGSSGTADITCDGVTKEVEVGVSVESYTLAWNTRGGSESIPLLEITAAEIANQYSRPKHLIQMNIQESSATDIQLNLLGNIEDSLNQYSATNRIFVVNRAELKVRSRMWTNDLIEIIP